MKCLLITLVLIGAIITSGCVSSNDKNTITPAQKTTASPKTVTTVHPKIGTTLPTKTVTPVPTKITPKPTLSSDQAKSIANITISMTAQAITMSKGMVSPENLPKMPNGKTFPVDGVAGDPVAKTMNGVPVWEVPVISHGVRVGELYLKREQ